MNLNDNDKERLLPPKSSLRFPPLVRKKHVTLENTGNPYNFHFDTPYQVQIDARSFTNGRMCNQHFVNHQQKLQNSNNQNRTSSNPSSPTALSSSSIPNNNVTALEIPTGCGKTLISLTSALHAQSIIAYQNLARGVRCSINSKPPNENNGGSSNDGKTVNDQQKQEVAIKQEASVKLENSIKLEDSEDAAITKSAKSTNDDVPEPSSNDFNIVIKNLQSNRDDPLLPDDPSAWRKATICATDDLTLRVMELDRRYRIVTAKRRGEIKKKNLETFRVLIANTRPSPAMKLEPRSVNLLPDDGDEDYYPDEDDFEVDANGKRRMKFEYELTADDIMQDARELRFGGEGGSSSGPNVVLPDFVPKIFICTRTHSQIDEFKKELKRFSEARDIDPLQLSFNQMRSRVMICPIKVQLMNKREKEMEKKHGKLENNKDHPDFGVSATEMMSLVCDIAVKRHDCKFHESTNAKIVLTLNEATSDEDRIYDEWNLRNNVPQNVGKVPDVKTSLADIEDLARREYPRWGTQVPDANDNLLSIKPACPYFLARAYVEAKRINFMPYIYILDPKIRSAMKFDKQLAGSIVVIDEAHNIPNVLKRGFSFEFERWSEFFRSRQDLIRMNLIGGSCGALASIPQFNVESSVSDVVDYFYCVGVRLAQSEIFRYPLHTRITLHRKHPPRQQQVDNNNNNNNNVTCRKREMSMTQLQIFQFTFILCRTFEILCEDKTRKESIWNKHPDRALNGNNFLDFLWQKFQLAQQEHNNNIHNQRIPFQLPHDVNKFQNDPMIFELCSSFFHSFFTTNFNPFNFTIPRLNFLQGLFMMLYHVSKYPYQFSIFGEEEKANQQNENSENTSYNNNILRPIKKLFVNCLDPRIGWADFKSTNPHHVVLMSGTLGQPTVLTTELGDMFVKKTEGAKMNNNNDGASFVTCPTQVLNNNNNSQPPTPAMKNNNNNNNNNDFKHIPHQFLKMHDPTSDNSRSNLEKKHVEVMDADFPHDNKQLIEGRGFVNFSLPSISSLERTMKYNHSIPDLSNYNFFVGQHVINPKHQSHIAILTHLLRTPQNNSEVQAKLHVAIAKHNAGTAQYASTHNREKDGWRYDSELKKRSWLERTLEQSRTAFPANSKVSNGIKAPFGEGGAGRFAAKSDLEVLYNKDLAFTILKAACATPSGTLVFLPSYDLINPIFETVREIARNPERYHRSLGKFFSERFMAFKEPRAGEKELEKHIIGANMEDENTFIFGEETKEKKAKNDNNDNDNENNNNNDEPPTIPARRPRKTYSGTDNQLFIDVVLKYRQAIDRIKRTFSNNNNNNGNDKGEGIGRAIFFCVFRGKLSEGVNLSDEYCRGVICYGIPLAAYDKAIKAQIEFYNNTKFDNDPSDPSKKDRFSNKLVGEIWYKNDAICAVSQAVGRVLRHKNDYGSIILIDERYTTNEFYSLLPRWFAQASVRVYSSTSWRKNRDILEDRKLDVDNYFKVALSMNANNNQNNNFINPASSQDNNNDLRNEIFRTANIDKLADDLIPNLENFFDERQKADQDQRRREQQAIPPGTRRQRGTNDEDDDDQQRNSPAEFDFLMDVAEEEGQDAGEVGGPRQAQRMNLGSNASISADNLEFDAGRDTGFDAMFADEDTCEDDCDASSQLTQLSQDGASGGSSGLVEQVGAFSSPCPNLGQRISVFSSNTRLPRPSQQTQSQNQDDDDEEGNLF